MIAAQGNQLKYEDPDPQKLPQWPTDSNQRLHCLSGKESCIQTAHAQHALLKEFVQTNHMALQNADALSQYASLEFMPPRRINDPAPSFIKPLLALTAVAAWHWVEDRPQLALAQVCRNMQTGHRLMQANSGLTATMVGGRLMQRNNMMMAEMLAEQPQWAQQLPDPCKAALEPLPPVFERYCSAMRAEFQLYAQTYDDFKTFETRNPLFSLFDAEHNKAMTADMLAPACRSKHILGYQKNSSTEKNNDYKLTVRGYIMRPAC